ncbi:unnamed protein product [marine sediment metagenome]|uniref:Uncharacterized protein n=1 Tax=marine sediment metagenome TaxID=412755 RepID=X1MAY1_9ZZZZ
MSLLIKGVTTHAALTDVNTPHLLAELENAVCSETEADDKDTAAIAAALISTEDYTYIPSEDLRNSNDAERSTEATEYVMVKEVLLNADLAGCRIKFDGKGHVSFKGG